MNEEQEEIKIKRGRGRPKNADGVYAPKKKPLDPEYFKKYYHRSSVSEVIECELCTRHIVRRHILKHQNSTRCKPIYKIEMVELPEII